MDWQGIRNDTGATGEGAYRQIGTEMRIQGELQRRPGMELAVAQSGIVLTSMWSPIAGRFAVFSTAAGSIISEAV